MESILIYILPIIISLTITLGTGLVTLRRQKVLGARSFALVLFFEAAWTVGYLFETISPTLEAKEFWDTFAWVPTFALSLVLLDFSMEYAGILLRRSRLFWGLLGVIPLAELLLIFSNPLHQLMITNIQLIQASPFSEYTYDFGPLLWVGILYIYILLVIAIIILVGLTLHQRGLYRLQSLVILLGILVPLIGTILSVMGIRIGPHRDNSTYTFALANLIIAFGLFRFRIFDVLPFARDLVMESMEDGVIILDSLRRLVDINQAAQMICGRSEAQSLGQPIEALGLDWLPDTKLSEKQQALRTEVLIGNKEQAKTYDLRITRLASPAGELSGFLILLRDISDRKRAEVIMEKAYAEMEQQVVDRTGELLDTVAHLEEEISERQLVEEALRGSEVKFRAVIEQSSEAFVLLGSDGRVIELNPAYEQLVRKSREELLNRFYWDVFLDLPAPDSAPAERREWMKSLILEAIQTGKSPYFGRPLKGEVVYPDGSRRYIQQVLFLVRTDEGNRIGSMTLDVTDQTRAQQEAQQQAQNLNSINQLAVHLAGLPAEADIYQLITEQIRTIIGAIGCIFALYDAESGCLLGQTAATSGLILKRIAQLMPAGFKRMKMPLTPELKQQLLAEVVGYRSNISEVTFGAMPELLSKILQQQLGIGEIVGISFQSENELFGTMAIFLPRGAPRPAHTLLETFAHVVSVTLQRRRAEEALRNSEERFRSLLENSNELISVIDVDGNEKYTVNLESHSRILGYPFQTLAKRNLIDFIHPDDRSIWQQALTRVLKVKQPPELVEYRCRRADGSWIYLEAYVENLLDHPAIRGIVVTSRDVTRRKLAEEEQRRLNRTLRVISECNLALVRLDDEASLLQAICNVIINYGGYRFTWIGYQQGSKLHTIRIAAYAGRQEDFTQTVTALEKLQSDQILDLFNTIAPTSQPLIIGDTRSDPLFGTFRELAVRRGILSIVLLPLMFSKELYGVLAICASEVNAFDLNEVALLTELANDVSFGVHARRMRNDRDRAERLAQQANQELVQAYESTLEGWSHALEMRERETAGHSRRVVEMTLSLARRMGLSEEDCVNVRRGALLHDIGKMGIPDSILLKPAGLNEEEWEIMRQHPAFARQLLSGIPYLEPALVVPYYHHERWDGSGYPQGLKGEEIPLEARIFAVVDAWDALLFDRPYRQGWSEAQVVQFLTDNAGILFDPQVVRAFVELLKQEG